MTSERYRILSDLVLTAHLGFITFVSCGGWLALRWHWIAWVHIPAAVWGDGIEFGGWFCPLTPLENWLRRAAGGAAYSGGFVDHYLLPIVYPAELSRAVQILLGGALLAINITAYGILLRRRSNRAG